jgi:nitric oxide reductase NorQ protein
MKTKVLKPEEHYINDEPYYQPIGEEIRVFDAAYKQRLPVLLKGPTGCGKTRFMEHMAWRLKRPLITVSCHDDLTASDLVGRFLIASGETIWVDGSMARLPVPCATAPSVTSMKSWKHARTRPW